MTTHDDKPNDDLADPLLTFTDEDLAELLKPESVPAHLIETGGWEHLGITDSVEWLHQQRQARRERRRTRWQRD